MALNAYLRIMDSRGKDVKGSVTQSGREGSIMVTAATHDLINPFDANNMLGRKRQHKPFVITKSVDMSSPMLYKMQVENDIMNKWRLEFWRPSPTGTEVKFYTVELVDAKVASIHFEMPNNVYRENMPLEEYEQVSFVYKRIIWIFEQGGITTGDDWQ